MTNKRGKITVTVNLLEEKLKLPGRILDLKIDHESGCATIIVDNASLNKGLKAKDITNEWLESLEKEDSGDEDLCSVCGGEMYVANRLVVYLGGDQVISVHCPTCGLTTLKSLESL